MTANVEKINRELDQLLEGGSTIATDPALQTATVLLSLEIEKEAAPPADLRARWVARTKPVVIGRKSFMQTLRARPVMAFLVALLILLTLSGVAYALGKSLGYIPGAGLIENDSSLRVLEKPLAIERDNIVLNLEQVVASPDKTIIIYNYIQPDLDLSTYQFPTDPNPSRPVLQLPDGVKLDVRFGRRMSANGLQADNGYPIRYSLEFPPLPVNVMEVTLELPGLPSMHPGVGPEDWQIPLKLIPAPEGMVLPVFEVTGGTPGKDATTELTPSSQIPSKSISSLHDISISLDLFVPMEDGTLLIGSMHWDAQDYPAYAVKPSDFYMKVSDATGREIAFEPVLGTVLEKPEDEEYRSYWVLKVLEKDFAAPLKISIDSVTVDMSANPFIFQFDPGPNPVLGQSWDINKDIQISDIQTRILNARWVIDGPNPDPVFQFTVQSKPNELVDMYIGMPINQCMDGGGGTPTEPSEIIQVYTYLCRKDLPSGPLEVQVNGAVIWGPWEVEWTSPETSSVESPISTNAPPAAAEACLNFKSWQQALKNNNSIPSSLTGTLVLANTSGEISTVNLNSGEREVVGHGDAPSLSPDGSRVVMVGPIINSQPPNGLYLTDLVSRNSTLLPGTANGDDGPLWSPDGSRIAFTRGPAGSIGAPGAYNIMVVNSDGSDLRQITFSDQKKWASAWMPDSIHLIYIVSNGLKSGSVQMINTQTGEVNQLFEINYGYGSVVISPDGKRAAYEDWMPDEKYALFVSNLDGSNRKLLAQGNETTVVGPAWSPDGQWVIASVYTENTDSTLALIQPDTCEIVPLPNLSGYVGSWLP